MISKEKSQDELIDQLLAGCGDPKEILGKKGLLHQLQKKLVERALEAELEDHLGYPPHERTSTANARNGRTKKTVKTDSSELETEVPRDREDLQKNRSSGYWPKRKPGWEFGMCAASTTFLSNRFTAGRPSTAAWTSRR